MVNVNFQLIVYSCQNKFNKLTLINKFNKNYLNLSFTKIRFQ